MTWLDWGRTRSQSSPVTKNPLNTLRIRNCDPSLRSAHSSPNYKVHTFFLKDEFQGCQKLCIRPWKQLSELISIHSNLCFSVSWCNTFWFEWWVGNTFMLSVWSSVLLTYSSSEHVVISRYIHATLPFCKFTLFCDVVVNSKWSAFKPLHQWNFSGYRQPHQRTPTPSRWS